MKYLNKIIFINSANIPYAEISVDGNVHFTGTQGVGKSTVLRALLFFYNADKHRLGIQQGQKSFDEFYFRQSNSYILYEVMREGGAYTIFVSRYQGRASWRFIDAPYQKECGVVVVYRATAVLCPEGTGACRAVATAQDINMLAVSDLGAVHRDL